MMKIDRYSRRAKSLKDPQRKSVNVDKVQYQKLMRKLIYLAQKRPGVAYAVSVVN